ncbi:N-acetyltransferase [Mycolicibacterium sp. 018/SC-01/001]|uniref:GNAT family N-acetyltransferase n=1 Tax=Mycolicibacterium sp. 018/SC-01/001 TaxID=2592069 RepID=UPI00117ECC1D|nr:GNAT family N-acetyltransferase [Mycolicibacterium sp. 018/SC-01/001]TRW88030.1 N-acetyltransferase [Mycolicibacterium sp. 018/SC-01/001]
MAGVAANLIVRPADAADASACVAIYRPFVEDTAITFEIEVPTAADMAARIELARTNHEWLVLEKNSSAIGYAYARAFNPRPAYRWSTETSIYLSAEHHRTGGGRRLYTELLKRLAERGYRRAFAGISQPNEASVAFHRCFGFEPAGLYRRVGWKQGRWHDVAWMQADLGETAGDAPPTPIM